MFSIPHPSLHDRYLGIAIRMAAVGLALLTLTGPTAWAQGSSRPAASPVKNDRVLKIDRLLFQIPKGWRAMALFNGVYLVPIDLPNDQYCSLAVLPEASIQGEFTDWFETTRSALTQGERLIARDKVTLKRTGDGNEIAYAGSVTENDRKSRFYNLYLGVRQGSRASIITFSATHEELFKKYQPALQEFVRSLRYADRVKTENSPRPK